MGRWDGPTLVQYGWNLRAAGEQQEMIAAAAAVAKSTTGLMGQPKEFRFYSVLQRAIGG